MSIDIKNLFKTNVKVTENPIKVKISNFYKFKVTSVSLAVKVKCTQEILLSALFTKKILECSSNVSEYLFYQSSSERIDFIFEVEVILHRDSIQSHFILAEQKILLLLGINFSLIAQLSLSSVEQV